MSCSVVNSFKKVWTVVFVLRWCNHPTRIHQNHVYDEQIHVIYNFTVSNKLLGDCSFSRRVSLTRWPTNSFACWLSLNGQRAAWPFRSNVRLWTSSRFTVITLSGLESFISTRNVVFAYFLWDVRSSFGTIYHRHFNRNKFVLIVIANWSMIEMSHH